METPKGCEEHQPKYKQNAWQLYTIAELGQWVHLFMKRAEHRTDLAKREKDLIDAQNYLHMMQSKLDEEKHKLKIAQQSKTLNDYRAGKI